MWRPKVYIGCTPQLFLTSYFEMGSLTECNARWWAGCRALGGCRAPGSCLSLPTPMLWFQMCAAALALFTRVLEIQTEAPMLAHHNCYQWSRLLSLSFFEKRAFTTEFKVHLGKTKCIHLAIFNLMISWKILFPNKSHSQVPEHKAHLLRGLPFTPLQWLIFLLFILENAWKKKSTVWTGSRLYLEVWRFRVAYSKFEEPI